MENEGIDPHDAFQAPPNIVSSSSGSSGSDSVTSLGPTGEVDRGAHLSDHLKAQLLVRAYQVYSKHIVTFRVY